MDLDDLAELLVLVLRRERLLLVVLDEPVVLDDLRMEEVLYDVCREQIRYYKFSILLQRVQFL